MYQLGSIGSQLGSLQIRVANTPGKKVEHQGIKVQLLGQIELKTDKGNPHDFLALGKHYQCLMCFVSSQTILYAFMCNACDDTCVWFQ